MDIYSFLDLTLLDASATERDIVSLCNEALTNNYKSVCINSCYVLLANQLLRKTPVKICSVVGFPLGAMSTAAKVFEAKKAIEDGADEIEMVINIGLLKSRNYMALLKDIIDVKLAIGKKPLKVIIEINKLSKNEVIKACEICLDAKADYIKTCTGIGTKGSTLTSVKIIKKTIKDQAKIAASGNINDIETAKKYIELGVESIGTNPEIKKSKAKIVSKVY
ncbi:deoxyribose-phosphate aldolase [Yeosuana aromativorans]|uniref:Deoxyribose-phosphate aldolase n=1 Tax=Yeosuana aromativorans TaxID=288019 RepID=A0A8J3FEJ4_9FLAO|nr:deoxyribose-phosphate aldolase [Yeosuana aromativorans]GGK15909.1 deoxyribose-phosphate aldolase [Yeosuana aromativorans]